MVEPLAIARSSFETTDPERARDAMAAAYSDNHLTIKGSPEHFHFSQSRTDLGGVHLDRVTLSMTTHVVGQPVGSVMVGHVVDRDFDLTTGSHRHRYGPGDVFFGIRPGEDYSFTCHGIDVRAVGVDLGLVQQVVDGPAHEVVARFTKQPVSPSQARTWLRTVDFLSGQLLSEEHAATNPLVLRAAGRLLAATMVAIWDPDGREPAPRDRTEATPQTVRRAVAYIEANPHLDLGVADIARASFVGVRGLQLAFRRHLDTTPMAYLRRVRLDHARRDLLSAVPGDAQTVTETALRWGYTSARFAQEYRATFGELPSETLRS